MHPGRIIALTGKGLSNDCTVRTAGRTKGRSMK